MNDLMILRTKSGSPLTAVACGDDFLAAAGSQSDIMLWKKNQEFSQSRTMTISAGITSMAAGDKQVYVGTSWDDGSVKVYSTELGLIQSAPSGFGSVFDMVHDAYFLVTGLADGMLRIWKTSDLQCVQEIKAQEYFVLSVAADSELVYGGGTDNCTNVFSRNDASQIASLEGHDASVFSLAVNDIYVFSGSGEIWWGGPGAPRPSVFESAVRVWSKNDWECVQLLEGHQDNINALCVGSQAVFSASDDGTARFYRLDDWSQGVIVNVHPTRITCMCQDARHLYLGCSDGTIRIADKRSIL